MCAIFAFLKDRWGSNTKYDKNLTYRVSSSRNISTGSKTLKLKTVSYDLQHEGNIVTKNDNMRKERISNSTSKEERHEISMTLTDELNKRIDGLRNEVDEVKYRLGLM